MTLQEFQDDIRAGIPDVLPAAKPYDKQINHAPRRKEILTPEERVRRHLIAYLVSACGAPARRIVQEYPVSLNGPPPRAAVVVVDDAGCPLLLAECKAPEVELGQRAVVRRTVARAVRYTSVLGARYVSVTNGLRHLCYEFADGAYRPMTAFPVL